VAGRGWGGAANQDIEPRPPGRFRRVGGPDQARPDAARLPPNVSNRTLARLVHGWFTTVAPG